MAFGSCHQFLSEGIQSQRCSSLKSWLSGLESEPVDQSVKDTLSVSLYDHICLLRIIVLINF